MTYDRRPETLSRAERAARKGWSMTTLRGVIAVVLVAAAAPVEAQERAAGADRGGAYRKGSVSRVSRNLVEFRLGRPDGVHVGARLPVVRPSAGGVVVDEVVVTIVDDHQAVGKCQRNGVRPGDVVVTQRTSTYGGRAPSTDADGLAGLFAEVTLVVPPQGETRTTFNAQIERISWSGLVDIRDVEAILLTDRQRRTRYTLTGPQIKQLKVNGHLFVNDAPKDTLVTAEIHDFRTSLRAEEARRERMRLAEIASAERVRIAETRARIESDSAERVRLAQLASAERVELERLQTEREKAVAQGKADERLRAEAVLALAREEYRRTHPTAPPYPMDGGGGGNYGGNSGFSRPTGLSSAGNMETLGKLYGLVKSVNGAYKAFRNLDTPNESRADGLSKGFDAVDSVKDVFVSIMSLN